VNRLHTLQIALLLVALVVAGAHVVLYWDWLADDAYISWRYARNLVEGYGPVYNPGERVEGFSNPTWVALGALSLRLGADPADVARGVGLASVVLSALLAFLLVRRLRPGSRWAPLLPAAALAFLPAFTAHATNGLETSWFALQVLALAWLGADRAPIGSGRAVATALLALGVIWTRPEGLMYAAVAAGFQLQTARRPGAAGRRGVLISWLVVAAVSALLLVARLVYYGSLLPNTYQAKMTGTAGGLIDGLQYLGDFFREGSGLLLPALALVPVVLGLRTRGERVLLLFVAAGLAFAVVAGGDWMEHHRFLAPILPPLAVLAGLGAADLWAQLRDRSLRRRLALALGLLFAIAALGSVNVERILYHQAAPALAAGQGRVQVYAAAGRWLAEASPPDALVAASDIGALGYYSRRPILDMFGLVDTHLARRPGKQHGKIDVAYVLDRQPDVVVLIRDDLDPDTYHRIPDGALARRPEFRERYESVREFPLPGEGEVLQVYFARRRGGNRRDRAAG
jgi:arabinofuranosyltransferase